MRLFEFTNTKDYEDVDMFDDLQFFMMEDPSLYRTVYYPKVIELKKLVNSGKHPSPDFFEKPIKTAISAYIAKFKVPPQVQKKFTPEGITELSKSLINSELQKGNQNGREGLSDV